ncbi:ATP12 family protein [Saccharibacter floricola]|uniref:ATP synthase F1 mitochondrial assembly chaperone n=1 Tax=Saccharibacter floricola DSM 15669 TaxID=1123227 RepID=A0ABQ0NWW1_9PROT|nr:ATP12 family protein [Saccharibacter floricola]GBQ05402.1 ATP synthase F1 mitochondrial assembly chaperone [Saccharibacter floricola DSM 15669]
MSQPRKRFWKEVTLDTQKGGLYAPALDGRPVKLPKGTTLAVASKALGQALVKEWQAIEPKAPFTPEELPLTRMSGTRIERVAPYMDEMREQLLAYGLDDALCYRSAAQDEQLVGRVLAWAKHHHALSPDATTGIMPLSHPQAYQDGLARLLGTLDADTLAALGVIAPVFGSLLLAFAVIYDVLSLEEAVALGQADERYQLKKWGHDAEMAQTLERKEHDIREAMQFLSLVRQG